MCKGLRSAAVRTGLIFGWSLLPYIVVATAGQRPEIRIAVLHDIFTPFTPYKFMMKYFNTTGRALLPDFDVVLHAFPHRADSGSTPVEVVNILSADTPTYHAIAGPFSKQDNLEIARLTAQARILHVNKGDNPSFSDRTLYPYAFRVLRSVQGICATWFFMMGSNDWREAASVWVEQDTFDTANVEAKRYNVTSYQTLAEAGVAAWAVEAWQLNVVDLVRDLRIRNVILYIAAATAYQTICRVHVTRISGLQYYVPGAYSASWFLESYDPSLGTCSGDDMYTALRGHIRTVHTPFAPGLNLLGVLATPALNGDDQSQIPLTCMPNITAHLFYNSFELLTMGVLDGLFSFTDLGAMQIFLGNAGSETDQVCAVLVALHDAIYRKGVSLASIEDRDEDAFSKIIESVGNADFYGPTGRFRFYNGTGDAEYIYFSLLQAALPGVSNYSLSVTALSSFSGGMHSPPSLTLTDPQTPLVWHDGSTGLGPKPWLAYLPDCGEVNGELVWDKCVPCTPGTFYDSLLRSCRTCPPGQYQSQSAASSCLTALPGWYVADPDLPVAPVECLAGHECPQVGMVAPQPCSIGRFAATTGKALCDLCPTGRYQPEESAEVCLECDTILRGGTTVSIASASPAACVCPEGTYRPLSSDYCERCPEGMVCPKGSSVANLQMVLSAAQGMVEATAGNSANSSMESSSDLPYPLLQRGYMTLRSSPLKVYKCLVDSQCPGGAPGSCAQHRDSSTVACGDCLDNAYEVGDECHACGDDSVLPFIAAAVLGVSVVIGTTFLVNRDVHKTSAASLLIVAMGGLLFTSMQAFGIFSQMNIPWTDPVKSMLQLTQIFSFDLRLLKLACVVGVNPVRSFALRQSIALLTIPFVWAALLWKRYSPCGNRRTNVAIELSNSIGTLFSVFFISIVISAMEPFICYEHPAGNGESVRAAPSLLCFTGDGNNDHAAMVSIALIAFCVVPVPFLTLCTVGIIMYPRAMMSRNGSNSFLHAMRFLFFRYTPRCYFFQMFVLLRSLLICLIPAVLRGKDATQVLVMCVVLAGYVVAEEELRPWRAKLCNPLDAGIAILLAVMLTCGGLFLEDVPDRQTIAVLSSIVMVGIVCIAALGILIGFFNRLMPKPYYHFFICHHKAHAAAQARFLKTLLQQKRRSVQVFIDSDDLEALDELFDTVKTRVKHLVVYLTSDTLKRPWCVGEIVTAFRSRLQVTRLETPGFVIPTDDYVAKPETYLDTAGCNLSEYGIDWDSITAAFQQLLRTSTPRLELNSKARGTKRLDLMASALLRVRVALNDPPRLTEVPHRAVLLATFPESDEASASGGILLLEISQDVFRVCDAGVHMLADYEGDVEETCSLVDDAAVVVVMLTSGCLQSSSLVNVMCRVMALQQAHGIQLAPGVMSVNTPGFEFPSPDVLEATCETVPGVHERYGSLAIEYLRSFFKLICVPLPTHASQQALATQAAEVFHRIKVGFKGKSSLLGSADHLPRTWTGMRGQRNSSELKCQSNSTSVETDGAPPATQRLVDQFIGKKKEVHWKDWKDMGSGDSCATEIWSQEV